MDIKTFKLALGNEFIMYNKPWILKTFKLALGNAFIMYYELWTFKALN